MIRGSDAQHRQPRQSGLRPVARLLAVCLAVAWGHAVAAQPLAEPVWQPDRLVLQVAEPAGGWLLTVSGPEGFYARREFVDRQPQLPLLSEDGTAAADGSYTWELRALSGDGPAQSGHFRVRDGAIVVSPAPETEPAAAGGPLPLVPTVFADDVIVQGEMCVGSACASDENMPIETLRLKADNTWIRFEDNSLPTFPDTDWQLRVNDASGVDGIERFTIEELTAMTKPLTILAGAPDHSLWVDGSGRVGLGTATPAVRLHVMGSATIEGDFAVISSRAVKQDFRPVDEAEILQRLAELQLGEWSLKADPDSRHLGPVAEDFHQAFGLGRDPRHLSPADVAGVALAAVRGLQRLTDEGSAELARRLADSETEIARLRHDRDELALRVSELERRLAEVAAERQDAPAATDPRAGSPTKSWR